MPSPTTARKRNTPSHPIIKIWGSEPTIRAKWLTAYKEERRNPQLRNAFTYELKIEGDTLKLPLPIAAPNALKGLSVKKPLRIHPPGWSLDVFPMCVSTIFYERNEHALRTATFPSRPLVPDGKSFYACGISNLLTSYSHLILTEPGHEELAKRFGRQLKTEELATIHANVATLVKSPPLLQSIEILLGLWNELGCDKLNKPLTKGSALGTIVKSSCGIADALLRVAEKGGIHLRDDLTKPCDDGILSAYLELARTMRSLTTSCGSDRAGEFRTESPESTVSSLIEQSRDYRYGMEKLASAVTVSLQVRGGRTFHVSVPVTESGLQQSFKIQIADDGSMITTEEVSSTPRDRKLFLAALSVVLKRTVTSNFDYATKHPEIAREYEIIRERVGYLDYIAMLASKAIGRAQQNPELPMTFPVERIVGTAGQKIGFQAENLHTPFRITKSPSEVGNNTFFGERVQVQGGPNSCGKTYQWRRVVPQSRIAAGMGDFVYADSCYYDPACRILTPLIPEWLDRSEGGYLALVREIGRGMKQAFSPADIIILDETGGVTANMIEHRRLKEIALQMAKRGRAGVIITHSDSLINELAANPIKDIGLLNVGVARKGRRLVPMYLVRKGAPDWDLYSLYAEQLARDEKRKS